MDHKQPPNVMKKPRLEDMPEELRAKLKCSYANPDCEHWIWDCSSFWYGDDPFVYGLPEYGQWVLPLYSDTHYDWGDVRIIPIAKGKPLPYGIEPGPGFKDWALQILGGDPDTFFFTGTIEDVKRQLDSLLARDSPAIPPIHIPPELGSLEQAKDSQGQPIYCDGKPVWHLL